MTKATLKRPPSSERSRAGRVAIRIVNLVGYQPVVRVALDRPMVKGRYQIACVLISKRPGGFFASRVILPEDVGPWPQRRF